MSPLDPYNKLIQAMGLNSTEVDNSAVLERHQTFCLRYAPLTQQFCIFDGATATVLFKTNQWADAYRFWLQLLRQEQLNTSLGDKEPLSKTELHSWIEHCRNNPEFGQLLYSRDLQLSGILQYGVQLSGNCAIRWAASHNPATTVGQFILEKIGRRQHRLAKWAEQQPLPSIEQILQQSIEALHQGWDYNLYQFNSEHWARLTVTGHCWCLQTEELYRHWQTTQTSSDDMTPQPTIWEINTEVEKRLQLAITP